MNFNKFMIWKLKIKKYKKYLQKVIQRQMLLCQKKNKIKPNNNNKL